MAGTEPTPQSKRRFPGPLKIASGEGGPAVTFDEEGKILSIESMGISDSIARLSKTDPRDVQGIAASQLELLAAYHQIVLAQSRRSFFWAVIGSGLGLLFFIAAVTFALVNGVTVASIFPLISGAVVEVVSGVVFYLYGQTAAQLSNFHNSLEVLQRYLLANSLCETLDGDERSKARAGLIRVISESPAASSPIPTRQARGLPRRRGNPAARRATAQKS
jgi:hypothetical protein